LNEWGQPTTLAVTIPLANEQLSCDWPDTKDNIARRKFCSHYEGYGELCDCELRATGTKMVDTLTMHVMKLVHLLSVVCL